MIIGLSGYAQSGKDSVAVILVAKYGYRRIAFADKLRDVALALDPIIDVFTRAGDVTPVHLSVVIESVGWDRAKTEHPEVRNTLQTLGVAVRTHIDPDAWVKAALAGVDRADDVVISDVRFRNEADAIDGIVVRVTRPGVTAVNGHISEHDLDGWPFDRHIYNDGDLADLEAEVDRLVSTLR